MNRRSFIADMLKAGVACTFLPGAGRIWKPVYESDDYCCIMEPPPHHILHSEEVTLTVDLDIYFQHFYEVWKKRKQMEQEYDVLTRFKEASNFAEGFFFSL